MKRRQLLIGSVATASLCAFRVNAENHGYGLRTLAENKGLYYGCAVASQKLATDAIFADAVAREANILVAEGEMKRDILQPMPDRYNFTAADYIFRSAQRSLQKVRGHTLVWHNSNPRWLMDALDANNRIASKEKLLTGYIDTVVRRYAGRVQSWDVVNEAVDPADWRWDGMRSSSIWYKTFGEDYLSIAFQAAREADPNTPLFLNEFGIENAVRWNETRRTAILKLLDRLLSKNVPIDGFGIQGHMKPFRDAFDEKVFSKFLDDLAGYGLKLMITEFDVADKWGPTSTADRDAGVAALTKSFLDVALSKASMKGVLTWGLTDKYSWLSSDPQYKWPDGQLVRGLPLDVNFARTPMWDEIAAAFTRVSVT
ncbi:endo-1,4-beta-xylanase [Rhizobium sp. VS19-DR104.2]|uniref:endo-1,4-beta-xylanase n=1 Tax=unclassified Rhizobium TaxID=2613769 RepID=UPI001CC3E814|nr:MULTISPECIES: endo-1,4-beta-xylanase [unclassified Rhizobium]MBZ5763443.1 endo-1,4-beta-xylanase [Rhizobium sp. VS19-DR96]MBZ5769338.1 endo-1,4-beta-xylanase [Rhizobium sp. VS19-DR129.2]MBZ5776908.1 endo-1,4-beta-xylanase [Rhizobium sp. VS19-DRK62.2]MBZ5788003.1 endo-1,4-beta-xylanase [Rhizobium sp. VS19-DR121]MBZ5805487.1 endo-1,4-beta-xylanase [Rhizobium sp. VS19-DR181]